ncbi:MAG: hypothetical protein LBM77_00965 [Spirochaetaceae bacterium]|jgi:hypothetical protein|nr:hypothetical protein [Spirochaetaceae bacterium]
MGLTDTIFTYINNRKTRKEIQGTYNQAADSNYKARSVFVAQNISKQQLLLVSNDPNDDDVYTMSFESKTPGVDYIWGDNKEPECMIVSGGENDARVRALMPFVRKSQQENVSVIALHNSDKDLEAMIQDNSIESEFVSQSGLYYDVFRGMSVEDMAYYLYDAMPKDTKPAAESLLHALLEVVLRTDGTITFSNLAAFPIHDLKDKLDSLQTTGVLPLAEYREIDHYYMSGSSELDSVRIFLNKLSRQAESVFGKPRATTCNIKKILNHHGVIAIDVGNVNNDLVFDLVVSHLMLLQSQGRNFSILLDELPLSRFSKARDLIRGRTYSISSRDFISDISGGEKSSDELFSEITGNVNTIVLLKHTSGTSCHKWSNHFGQYHKIQVKQSIAQFNKYNDMMTDGDNRSISVEEKDVPRVRAESIGKLSGSLACIQNSEGILFAEI